MFKSFLKILLSVIVCTFVYVLANAVMPFSQGLKELGASSDPMGMFYLVFVAAFVCLTMYYIIKQAQFGGMKLFIRMVFSMFFVQIFMAQIETLFFGYAFPVLTNLDVKLIMIAGLIPLLATTPILLKFFQNKNSVVEKQKIDVEIMLKKLGIIGVIYVFVYFIFGYFAAWQFEELRVFYSGSPVKLGFFAHLADMAKTNPIIYPFQFLRGILFGFFVIPLMVVFKTKKTFITGICLIYLYLGVIFIMPNIMFPNMVRLGHFIELTTSMLLFGIIVGNILWRKDQ